VVRARRTDNVVRARRDSPGSPYLSGDREDECSGGYESADRDLSRRSPPAMDSVGTGVSAVDLVVEGAHLVATTWIQQRRCWRRWCMAGLDGLPGSDGLF
jgi:hypothetical protein